ncbi:ATP synthase F1 subunit delta [Pedobacter petrophilus]|uniref:ATP synthase subunit delta n=1 Tax=Pedobacter petrophilus TaxID=1908241 RepID=A0A7K0FUS6_9SPHI|nr:ATP synthase F1 subunit delta [Pedobacter petrophilus]MRX75092.1 ATP synthase F1 subunit delta [Pedobacter petrophilus]
MSEIKVAGRYAKSLIDLSVENNVLAESYNDMILFEKVVNDTPELEAILKNPIVPLDKKTGILSGIFAGKVSKLTLSFFTIVVKKGRSSILFATAKQFVKQYNQIKGIVTADVISATALGAEAKAEIVAIVKRELGAKEVIFNEKVDDKLIGGFILKVGDKQFDASIANSLSKLKKELAH